MSSSQAVTGIKCLSWGGDDFSLSFVARFNLHFLNLQVVTGIICLSWGRDDFSFSFVARFNLPFNLFKKRTFNKFAHICLGANYRCDCSLPEMASAIKN